MYTNAVANNVMLQLYIWHDFYTTIFKIKQIMYSFRVSRPPQKFREHTCTLQLNFEKTVKGDMMSTYSFKVW